MCWTVERSPEIVSGADVEPWQEAPDLERAVQLGMAIFSVRAPLTRLLRSLGHERAARIIPSTYRRSGLLDLLGDCFAFEAALDAGGFDAPTPHTSATGDRPSTS